MPSMLKTNGVWPKLARTVSPGFFKLIAGYSLFRPTSLKTSPGTLVSVCTVPTKFVHSPSFWPFLVKNATLVRKFTPHPIVSPVLKFGPYVFPVFVPEKALPSSPWYPQDSDSQPKGLDREGVLVAKPIATVKLLAGQSSSE